MKFRKISGKRVIGLVMAIVLALSMTPLQAWALNPKAAPKTQLTPVKSDVIGELKSVSLGAYYSSVLDQAGNLYVWGKNNEGQVATGTGFSYGDRKVPAITLKSVVASSTNISFNGGHSAAICLAIDPEGNDIYILQAWGNNLYGQVGDDTRIERNSPVRISGLTNVTAVSLGAYHSAAIANGGVLYTWGSNSNGQLGNEKDPTNAALQLIYAKKPTQIMANVSAVSLGSYHSAAITADGSLWMWGANNHGQLGNGTKVESNVPVKIMDNVASVSLGWDYSAAITTDGSLWMWGYNKYGQVGNGSSKDVTAPVRVLDNVASVNLGAYHSSAVTNNGALYVWGQNKYGQVGDGTTTNVLQPLKILENVSSASMGGYHSAAITNNGELYMWGLNNYEQLGNIS